MGTAEKSRDIPLVNCGGGREACTGLGEQGACRPRAEREREGAGEEQRLLVWERKEGDSGEPFVGGAKAALRSGSSSPGVGGRAMLVRLLAAL